MTIKEYASEMGFTVQEVLNKCRDLGYKATDGNFNLDDDAIIMLDNSMNLISTDSDASFEEIDALDDAVDEILGDNHHYSEKNQKLKKKNMKMKILLKVIAMKQLMVQLRLILQHLIYQQQLVEVVHMI